VHKKVLLWVLGVPAVLVVTLYVALFVGLSRSLLVMMELPGQAGTIQIFSVWESGILNRITILATAGGESWTRVRARDLKCFGLDDGRGPVTGDLGPLSASLVSARLGAAGIPGTSEELLSDAQQLTGLVRAIQEKRLAAMTFRKVASLDGTRETDAMVGRFEVLYPRPGERIALLPGRALAVLVIGLVLGFLAISRASRWLSARTVGRASFLPPT
jgi:hypothetical protein